MTHPKAERTLVLIKPDGVMRGLTGEIMARFEKRGLKVIALKMVRPTREHITEHYPSHEIWFKSIGEKTSEFLRGREIEVRHHFGTDDHVEIGKQIKGWLEDYMTKGPVVAIILEGMHAISTVRKLIGHTFPIEAQPGTVRGDYSVDAPSAANLEKRVVKNIVHASANEEEASHEIEHWFSPEEIHDYKRADEDVMF